MYPSRQAHVSLWVHVPQVGNPCVSATIIFIEAILTILRHSSQLLINLPLRPLACR